MILPRRTGPVAGWVNEMAIEDRGVLATADRDRAASGVPKATADRVIFRRRK